VTLLFDFIGLLSNSVPPSAIKSLAEDIEAVVTRMKGKAVAAPLKYI